MKDSVKNNSGIEKVVMVGFGGHGRSIADAVEAAGKYLIVGYTDLQENAPNNGHKYLGTDDKLEEIFASGVTKAIIGLGQIKSSDNRRRLYEKLKKIGFELPVIIDKTAIISDTAYIGEGSFVGKGAIINCNASVGKMCIINSGVLCEHDVSVGDFSHVAVRATVCGAASVGMGCLIGANSTLIQGVSVGNQTVIGAGSLVRHDVPSGQIKYGII